MRKKSDNYWVSLSDIMTGLMVIFMFISISYIHQMKERQKERDQILEEFKNVKIALYQELKREFSKDFSEGKWDAILGEDLSIRFQNEKVLFDYDKSELKPEFKKILDSFFPRYFRILLKKPYRQHIAEVRIEGHTDSRGNYMYNLWLSHARVASVLKYFFESQTSPYRQFNSEDRELVRFWLTATGFSWGRILDSGGHYVIRTGEKEDRIKSRRVEFRIITRSDAVVKAILEKMEH
jgi:outer membrane protein OmpA-like peptidoglycan-associated protein